ncbi:hypothetical protein DFH29DRAFT_1081318 [Suillus ampliporus]|nr:hypothetical protein DFH29DRAFT_1081318 [Suillus ampliporus]
MSQVISSTTPLRAFRDHTAAVFAVAVFPDRRRMVTCLYDKTVRLWDLNTGAVLKKMEGHHDVVSRLVVSRDGQIIASGNESGEMIAWHGETGEPLTQPIKAHSARIYTLDFSPDGTVLATGSADGTIRLWNTKTWKPQGNPIQCSNWVYCVRYSPSGELLAIATAINIEIYNSGTREFVATFKGHTSQNISLAWTPDGTRLLSGVGDPWTGHTQNIRSIAIHPAGTLVASASTDNHVRLWRLSDRRTIAIFQHSGWAARVTFSMDGKHILSGGVDNMILEWKVPKVALPEDPPQEPESKVLSHLFSAPSPSHLAFSFTPRLKSLIQRHVSILTSDNTIRACFMSQILAINTSARNACIAGDLSTAEEIFTREINADASNFNSYANRSLVMARKDDWDHALDDAIKSITIQPSLTGYISQGIALCGKDQVRDARIAFDLASMFTNEDLKIVHFLLLVKARRIFLWNCPFHCGFQAIVLFSADQHEEAMQLVQQLAAACPNHDTLACGVVEAYFHVQLGIDALNGSRHNEAVGHFTTAVNSSALSPASDINYIYDDLVVLFGWDVNSLWKNAHRNRCDALCRAGSLEEALESYRNMMDILDEDTKASFLDWSNGNTLSLANGDTALAASDYDRAISTYSLAIDLNSASETIFAKRSTARSGKLLWDDALLDAEKVIELDPSSHVGYELKHAALHGAQRYDEAIEAFKIMLSKLDDAPEAQIRELRQQYVPSSEVEDAIRRAVWIELENAPLRLLNTSTGLLCDRPGQINTFKMTAEYKELLSFTVTKHGDLRMERIKEVVTLYFRCVLLSHRWEETESLLHDIQDKVVYELDALGSNVKLQSFCKVARDAGYFWAWMDTCCINKANNAELQESINSMFIWYRHSDLTVVYLSDVPPSSQTGALAESEWIRRGWTFQEFVAPKVVLFYRKDWTLYRDDRSPNHKESAAIMEELEGATGIDRQALVTFRPGMSGVRERLQWASRRVTTLQEDIAYSLFGIFGVHLPVIYGEKKQNALGRLLQEIVARSGDITALDWVGQSSEFNSCLPADISSYAAPAHTLPSLAEDEIQTTVSSLRNSMAVELALKFYDQLDSMSAPRFANCRLQLPCIAFRVTELRRRRGPAHETHFTYGVKADGLCDLQITTEQTLIQFSRARPARQTFILVHPWDRRLLEQPVFAEQPAFADDAESLGDWSEPESPLDDSPGASPVEQELGDSESRALRLVVRLEQPFSAFLLAQQPGGEYKRIASDHDIIAQVTDVASVHNILGGVRTLEIL